MIGQGIHKNIKHEDVARHEKNQKQKLSETEQLAAETTHQELASVSHAVDLGVSELKLTNLVASVP